MIASLFPESAVTVVGTPALAAIPLLPHEEACVMRAVPKRRREFAMGRACARQALSRIGIHDYPLVVGPDRAPVWPVGVVGSITHCDGYCGVVVARSGPIRGLGLDAEPALSLPPDIVTRVCRSSELAWAEGTSPPPAGDWFRIIFSAKESVYKCCHPTTRWNLDFQDVDLEIEPATGAFAARLVQAGHRLPGRSTLVGRFAVTATHVLTGATLAG